MAPNQGKRKSCHLAIQQAAATRHADRVYITFKDYKNRQHMKLVCEPREGEEISLLVKCSSRRRQVSPLNLGRKD